MRVPAGLRGVREPSAGVTRPTIEGYRCADFLSTQQRSMRRFLIVPSRTSPFIRVMREGCATARLGTNDAAVGCAVFLTGR